MEALFRCIMTLFLIVIHLGFASATALASAMIPIVIAVLQGVGTLGINVIGMAYAAEFAAFQLGQIDKKLGRLIELMEQQRHSA